MKYKTTIEIVSEAENKNEAVEIVGEYLSGNLVSGVDMKCLTKPVHSYNRYVAGALAVLLLVAVSALPMIHGKNPQGLAPCARGVSAVQPPLKTSAADKKENAFKKAWQDRQTKAALDFIKRK